MLKKSINLEKMRYKTPLILFFIVFVIILSFCTKKTTQPDEQLLAPSNLVIESLTAINAKLIWQDNCEREDGYLVYKKLEGTDWNIINVSPDTEEWIDENVIPGIINYYKVCAYLGVDHSDYIEDSLNTLPAPTNLQIEQQNVHTFALNWNDNSNFEQGFKIDRKIDDEEWINEIDSVYSDITTWIDFTLGRNYEVVYYRVYGYYEDYNSTKIESNSNIVFPAPTNLQYEILSVNSIKLTWNDNSLGEEGYKIDKKTGDENWLIEYATLEESTTEWIDENVNLSNNYYYYKIYSFYGDNISSKSEIEILNTFTKTFGGINTDAAYSVQQTTDGGYIVAGYTGSYGAGGSDFWLVKADENGNEEWNQTYGSSDDDYAHSVQQTTDGGYIIAGRTQSYGSGGRNFWLVKTDPNGNEMWNQVYGGLFGDAAYSVQQTSDGGYIVAGYTESYGAGEYDFWLVKTDANGNEMWNQVYGGWNIEWAYSVQQTTDGGYIIAGRTQSYGSGEYDVWMVKTDALGNEEWNRTFGGSDWDEAYSVQQTSDGGYIVAGYTGSYGAGSYDFWLIKTDENGNTMWNQTYGGLNSEYAYSVKQTTDGGYIIAGLTKSYGAGGSDFWLVKADENGNEEWNRTYGGSDDDYARSVQQTTDGGFIITGWTESYGAGSYDVWLIKTDSQGNVE